MEQVSAPGQGARRWVPAVKGVPGAGSQPSEGCWAPGLRAPPSPRLSGCGTSECSGTGCRAPGPNRQRGAGRRVPAVRGVLGTGSQPSLYPRSSGVPAHPDLSSSSHTTLSAPPWRERKEEETFLCHSSALCMEARVPGPGPDIHGGLGASCALGA